MRKGVCLERNLKEHQCCKLSKNGIVIYTVETEISNEENERLAYGSYSMIIFVGNQYLGRAYDIKLWGPLTLTQLYNMFVVVEIPKRELTIFGDKEAE